MLFEMSAEVKGLLIVIVFSLVTGSAFLLTYRNPNRNRLTRWLFAYVEFTRFPAWSTHTSLLMMIVTLVGVGLLFFVLLITGLYSSNLR
jgi:uncharacterized membrane-anchored protein